MKKKNIFIRFWEWVKYDLFDCPLLCLRVDRPDNGFQAPELLWCSPEYLSYKLGIGLFDCVAFINGPANNEGSGLYMNKALRRKFCVTDVTLSGEKLDKSYQAIKRRKEFKQEVAKHGKKLKKATTELKSAMSNFTKVAKTKQEVLNNVLAGKNPIEGDSIS